MVDFVTFVNDTRSFVVILYSFSLDHLNLIGNLNTKSFVFRFEYFAALIRTHEGTCPPFLGSYVNYVHRVPLGVVAQLTPWNHPMLIAVKKIAPAIATGNSIVLKPSGDDNSNNDMFKRTD